MGPSVKFRVLGTCTRSGRQRAAGSRPEDWKWPGLARASPGEV